MKENLRYLTLTQKSGEVGLSFYLTGGGAAMHFIEGEPAEKTIGKLRYLASLLEHGAKMRSEPEVRKDPERAFNTVGEALTKAIAAKG